MNDIESLAGIVIRAASNLGVELSSEQVARVAEFVFDVLTGKIDEVAKAKAAAAGDAAADAVKTEDAAEAELRK